MDNNLTFGVNDSRLKYQCRESSYAIIIDDNGYVATILTAKGSFLPGGGIEYGETPEECLLRELLEETGFAAEISHNLGKAQRYFVSPSNIPLLNIGNFFTANLTKKVCAPIEDDHELKWVHLSEADHLFFHEHQLWAVKKALSLNLRVKK
ncbi:NUDIX domain-containing protein [Paenibacillus ihuae]|uniref:NUDIX domain-containing protein n=1 Tax=Paenibacillus ihuae TaxID=1232431 RepID=UPI0006D53D8C|nr:NUDIX domain-containing protein [Paenibacillus ihuae]